MSLIKVGPSADRRRRMNTANDKLKRNDNALHQCQMESGIGFIVSMSMPNKQRKRGTRALPSKFHKRNLSRDDQSYSDLLRNATTTPANPANATAIWAATDNASPGSIVFELDRIRATRTNTKFRV